MDGDEGGKGEGEGWLLHKANNQRPCLSQENVSWCYSKWIHKDPSYNSWPLPDPYYLLGARHTLQLFNVCNIWSTTSCNPNRSARGTRCNFEPVPSQSHSK